MSGLINFMQVFGGGANLLLDDYPDAAVAYSLRYLRTAYVGSPVVRVRRSSDNVEQDFTPTEITDGTLTTFTGVNNGFVTTWYDQSLNLRNATQTNTVLQPFIVQSGLLVTESSKPAIFFNKALNQFMTAGSGFDFNLLTAFFVGKDTTGVNNVFPVSCQSNNNQGWRFHTQPNYRFRYSAVSNDITLTLSNYTDYALIQGIVNSGQGTIHFNSESKTLAVTQNTNLAGNLEVGKSTVVSPTTWQGNIQEIILYDTDKSANRADIALEINTNYNIY